MVAVPCWGECKVKLKDKLGAAPHALVQEFNPFAPLNEDKG